MDTNLLLATMLLLPTSSQAMMSLLSMPSTTLELSRLERTGMDMPPLDPTLLPFLMAEPRLSTTRLMMPTVDFADVQYSGEARYDEYKPAHGYKAAPAYKPAPVYHAAPVYKPAPVYHAAPVYKP